MKILHTADLHLGQIMYQYYDRVDEHDHYFRQLKGWCAEHQPDALLICGDVFDIPQPGATTKEHFNRMVADIHNSFPLMAIVIIAGNHDSAARLQADSVVWRLAGVTMLGQAPPMDALQHDDGWQDSYIVEIPNGFIAAMPFTTSSRKDVVQAILDRVAERNTEAKPVVLCGHLALIGVDFTGHGDIGNQRVMDTSEMGSGYDYMALGHIHRPQTVGHDISDENQTESVYPAGVVRYSGSALHVSCDERYPHSVSLVEMARHGGEVHVSRLRIDELRHFYIMPDENKNAPTSAEEVYEMLKTFCEEKKRGYIRLRLHHNTELPANFVQSVYQILEATGNEVRFNPKTIWEGKPEDVEEEENPTFEVAELQQMSNPIEFVLKTIGQYPGLKEEQLEDDFAEIERELRAMDEAEADKKAVKKPKPKQEDEG